MILQVWFFLQNCSMTSSFTLKEKLKFSFGGFSWRLTIFFQVFQDSVISRGLTWVWPWDYCKELQKTRFDINSDFEIWSSKKSENSETTLARKNLHEKVRSKIAPKTQVSKIPHFCVEKKICLGIKFFNKRKISNPIG